MCRTSPRPDGGAPYVEAFDKTSERSLTLKIAGALCDESIAILLERGGPLPFCPGLSAGIGVKGSNRAFRDHLVEQPIDTQAYDTIVVGAGQSGLAAGYALRQTGLRFAILEASDQIAGSWPWYYESLRLFSPARYASLPGLPFPGAPDDYPGRDEVVSYLAAYAEHFKLPVTTGTRVERVERVRDAFSVETAGATHRARTLIAATGSFSRPYLPEFPGQASFCGELLHSSAYRQPAAYNGRRVIVVGGGNSAVQIAVELGAVARVSLATRAPLKLTPQRILGRDIHFVANLLGLERVPLGRWISPREYNVVLDAGAYRRALRSGNPEWRPVFAAFTPDGVVWQDGRRENVDAVVFATGYRPNLPYLRDLPGALAADGSARQRGGVSLTTSGLYFLGLPAQRTIASATLRGVGADAGYVVRNLRRYLRQHAAQEWR